MDPQIARLTTPEECEQYAINVAGRLPEKSKAARRRAVELRALKYGAKTDVEREAIEAVYAYEELLAKRNGKRTRASRTWNMIKSHGIIEAIVRAVDRDDDPTGYQVLVEMGMKELSFEAIVIRHPKSFSLDVVT